MFLGANITHTQDITITSGAVTVVESEKRPSTKRIIAAIVLMLAMSWFLPRLLLLLLCSQTSFSWCRFHRGWETLF